MVQERVLKKKARIIDTAFALAKKSGYDNVTRDAVAEGAGVSTGIISYYFRDIDSLKSKIVELAVDRQEMTILRSALANRHPVAVRMRPQLKALVAKSFVA